MRTIADSIWLKNLLQNGGIICTEKTCIFEKKTRKGSKSPSCLSIFVFLALNAVQLMFNWCLLRVTPGMLATTEPQATNEPLFVPKRQRSLAKLRNIDNSAGVARGRWEPPGKTGRRHNGTHTLLFLLVMFYG